MPDRVFVTGLLAARLMLFPIGTKQCFAGVVKVVQDENGWWEPTVQSFPTVEDALAYVQGLGLSARDPAASCTALRET
jgi:hypothetical protein